MSTVWRGAVSVSQRLTGRGVPLALVLVGAVVVLGVGKLLRSLGQTFTSSGDVAFIELGVRRAVELDQQLGVYSRFGWHHPGPALLYALAPAYWLSGSSSRALFIGAWLVNGVCLLLTLVLVRARAGELAARLMAAVALLFLLVGGFAHMINPWNVVILAMPMLLLFVAAAASASGSAWALVALLGAGTYAVQTHLGTLWVVAFVVLAAIVGFVLTTRRKGWGGAGAWPFVVAVAVLAVMWLPPLVQEATGSPRNMNEMASFAIDPAPVTPTSHSLGDAVTVVTNRGTLIPFGKPADDDPHAAHKLALLGFCVLGVAVALGAWRRSRFVAYLALATPAGTILALLAAARVPGSLYPYLFYWAEMLPLPAVFASVWLVADVVRTRAERAVEIAALVLLVAAVAASVVVVARGAPTSFGDDPNARVIARRIEQEVGSKDAVFRISSGTVDGGAVFLTLVKDGYHFRVDPEVIQMYTGNTQKPVDGPAFVLRPPNLPLKPEQGKIVTRSGPVVLWRTS
jgi:hypothetical protein